MLPVLALNTTQLENISSTFMFSNITLAAWSFTLWKLENATKQCFYFHRELVVKHLKVHVPVGLN